MENYKLNENARYFEVNGRITNIYDESGKRLQVIHGYLGKEESEKLIAVSSKNSIVASLFKKSHEAFPGYVVEDESWDMTDEQIRNVHKNLGIYRK